MNTSVDISYYPLKEDFIAPIRDFIKRINTYDNIRVFTNGMSTQVFGEYFEVMEILTKEIHQSYALPHSVFIMKIVNADLQDYEVQKGK